EGLLQSVCWQRCTVWELLFAHWTVLQLGNCWVQVVLQRQGQLSPPLLGPLGENWWMW
ncbi:hypothetical protein NDU88_005325, partial [Pleurodeles waltl]